MPLQNYIKFQKQSISPDMLCYSCATPGFVTHRGQYNPLMYARNQKRFIQNQETNIITSGYKKPLGLKVANKKQPKVCAASYGASPITDEQINVFKHEFTAEIM